MDDLSQLQVTIADYVATLTMNAPPVNALTRVLNDELILARASVSVVPNCCAWALSRPAWRRRR